MEQSDTGTVQLDSLLATLRGHLTVGAAQSDSTARALIERVELVADEDLSLIHISEPTRPY